MNYLKRLSQAVAETAAACGRPRAWKFGRVDADVFFRVWSDCVEQVQLVSDRDTYHQYDFSSNLGVSA